MTRFLWKTFVLLILLLGAQSTFGQESTDARGESSAAETQVMPKVGAFNNAAI